MSAKLNIKVEFTGGLELLFGNKRKLSLSLPPTQPSTSTSNGRPSSSTSTSSTTLGDLIRILLAEHMQDPRREMFVQDGRIRPGVLVLVNDADWELEGEEAYVLQDGDCVLFVSTLHGG